MTESPVSSPPTEPNLFVPLSSSPATHPISLSPHLQNRDRSKPAAFTLTLPELAGMVLIRLPNAGVIARSRAVCRAWWGEGTRIIKRMFEIDDDLSFYFNDVVGFRRFQCEYDMLISGSFALIKFRDRGTDGQPTVPAQSDLDLYLEWNFIDEAKELMASEGYKLVGEWDNFSPVDAVVGPSIPDTSFESVMRFERADRHVDIILTTATPIYCIFSFHSTVVMNFISWDMAVCIFPRETLLDNSGLVLRLNNDRTRRAIQKYESRGFNMIHWLEMTRQNMCKRDTHRWVGDSRCLTIPLKTKHIEFGIDPDTSARVQMVVPSPYLWEANGFDLAYPEADGPPVSRVAGIGLWKPAMLCEMICHRGLLYSYAGSPAFQQQVDRYLMRRVRSHGLFWVFPLHGQVDYKMLRLKGARIRSDEDLGAFLDEIL